MTDERERLERIFADKKVSTDPVPLAAIFKTRRGRRREKAPDPDASWRGPTDPPVAAPPIIESPIEPPLVDSPLLDSPLIDLDVHEPLALDLADPDPLATQEIEVLTSGSLIDDAAEMDTQEMVAVVPSLPPMPDNGAHPLRSLIPEAADPAWARDTLLAVANQDARRFRTPTAGAWFAEMFTEEYLQSQPLRGDATTQAELRFLDWAMRLKGPSRLLDLGCGIGRHAVGFACAGHSVHGIDLSETMLRYAGRLAEHAQTRVEYTRMDMRDLDAEGEYDAAWSLNTSFGYFTDVENLILLRSIHRALKPAGRVIIDVINRDHAISQLPTRNWWEGDGCLIQEDIEFATRTSRLEVRRYLVFADGRERVYDISIRLFSAHELVQLLTLAGFIVESVSGSPHTRGAYFGPRSPRLLIVARRPTRGA